MCRWHTRAATDQDAQRVANRIPDGAPRTQFVSHASVRGYVTFKLHLFYACILLFKSYDMSRDETGSACGHRPFYLQVLQGILFCGCNLFYACALLADSKSEILS